MGLICCAIVGLVAVFLAWPGSGPGPVAGPTEALANGGTLRLANVPMGAYLVSVFTDPTPVRPDSLDVSVLVVSRSAGEVVEGLEVRVRTRHLDGAVADEERPATREQADDPRYYAAKFELGAEGAWEIRVVVDGPEGAGDAGFQVTARDRGLLGNPLVLVFLALLPLALVGGWITLQPGRSPGDGSPPDGTLPEGSLHGGSPPEEVRTGDALHREPRDVSPDAPR